MALSLKPWRKVREQEFPGAGAFLRERECFCVAACSRFMEADIRRDHVWACRKQGEIEGLLLHSRRSLFPVFSGPCGLPDGIPLPGFFSRFLDREPVHSIQGLREHTELFERGMEYNGFSAADRIDYDLMTLDGEVSGGALDSGPAGLVLRPPAPEDREELFRLHAAYEREEVIPRGGVFRAENCRVTVDRILASEHILLACFDGTIAGKINTNARSYTRLQIGGVYVRPEYRGHGIATAMSAAFLARLLARGSGISLFVKKRNHAARAVYRRLGFQARGDYRIAYY